MMKKFISGVRELIERISITVSLIKKPKPKGDSFLTETPTFHTIVPEGYGENKGNLTVWFSELRKSIGDVPA